MRTGVAHARHCYLLDDMDGISVVDLYDLSGIQLGHRFTVCVIHYTRDGLLRVLDRVFYREPRSVVRVRLGGVSVRFARGM